MLKNDIVAIVQEVLIAEAKEMSIIERNIKSNVKPSL